MKTINYNTLTALVSTAVILFSGMPQANADPHTEAAALFQRPLTWISSADRVHQSGQGSGKVIDAQTQAQHILQPVNDVAAGRAESVGSGIKSVEPQLQAAQLLNRGLQCDSYC